MIDLGGVTVDRIVEMEFGFRTVPELFIDVSDDEVAPHREALEPWAIEPESGRLVIAVQSYLVRTAHHTILIDTCVGCDKTSAFLPAWHMRSDRSWLDRLAAAGVRPEDVDFVMCTHLHSDHCGWNTQRIDSRWVPTFPNAKYVMTRHEFEAAEARGAAQWEESISPVIVAGQALLVDGDHALDDQVWFEPTPGHTPGHVAVGLSGAKHDAVMCGDLIHSPIQCVQPDWRYRNDADPDEALRTRRAFLEAGCESGRLVLTAHFPSPSMGRFETDNDAFKFTFV